MIAWTGVLILTVINHLDFVSFFSENHIFINSQKFRFRGREMGSAHNDVIAFSYFTINVPEWSVSAQRSRATVKCSVSDKTVSANYVQALTAPLQRPDLPTGVPTWTDLQFVFFRISLSNLQLLLCIFNVLGNCISKNFNLFQISMARLLKAFYLFGMQRKWMRCPT